MLNDADASGFKKVYLAMGFTDLRRGIDGLATIVCFQFKLDPYDKNTLFCSVEEDLTASKLYYGKAMDSFLCIKGLIMVRSDGRALQMKQCLSLKTSIVC